MTGSFKNSFLYPYRYAVGLMLATLGFLALGMMAHITENGMPKQLVQSWLWIQANMAGSFWLCRQVSIREQTHPVLCKRVFVILLMVLLGLMVCLIASSAGDFRFGNEIYVKRGITKGPALDRHALIRDILSGCRFFGRAAITEEQQAMMNIVFWRWRYDTALPVMCINYGLCILLIYMGLFAAWVTCTIGCLKTMRSMPSLRVPLNRNQHRQISLPRGLYGMAATVIILRLLGPLLDFGGLLWYVGGFPFMHMDDGFTEIIPFAAMLFVLYFFRYDASESAREPENVISEAASDSVSAEDPEPVRTTASGSGDLAAEQTEEENPGLCLPGESG